MYHDDRKIVLFTSPVSGHNGVCVCVVATSIFIIFCVLVCIHYVLVQVQDLYI